MSDFSIAGRTIGEHESPYVIAEISANHRHQKAAAVELIHAAHEAGADAVKLQHYTAETITVRSDHPDFKIGGGTLWDGRQLADLYAEAMTPWEWTADLAAAADKLGIVWFSSPFDPSAVDFLSSFNVPAYKIASFEILDLPLIRYTASFGKPLILSTGMATLSEIDAAVLAAKESGAPGVALLRCNSGYPAVPGEMDLCAIPVMRGLWQIPVGLSDHTLGTTAATVAVALGACIVEKHLTLRRADGGPDAEFSAEPYELANFIATLREAHATLGTIRFGPSQRERSSLPFRRSLRAVLPIAAGDPITANNVRSVRPAGGLNPDQIDLVVGMVADRDLELGAPVTMSDQTGRHLKLHPSDEV